MNYAAIHKLLSGHFGSNVYPDYVPEKVPLPALSYFHVSHQDAREINGKRTAKSDVWRLVLLAKDLGGLTDLIAKAEALDNTETAEYKRVLVVFRNGEAIDIGDEYRRFIIDLQTY